MDRQQNYINHLLSNDKNQAESRIQSSMNQISQQFDLATKSFLSSVQNRSPSPRKNIFNSDYPVPINIEVEQNNSPQKQQNNQISQQQFKQKQYPITVQNDLQIRNSLRQVSPKKSNQAENLYQIPVQQIFYQDENQYYQKQMSPGMIQQEIVYQQSPIQQMPLQIQSQNDFQFTFKPLPAQSPSRKKSEQFILQQNQAMTPRSIVQSPIQLVQQPRTVIQCSTPRVQPTINFQSIVQDERKDSNIQLKVLNPVQYQTQVVGYQQHEPENYKILFNQYQNVQEELNLWRNRYYDIEKQSSLLLNQPILDTQKYELKIQELQNILDQNDQQNSKEVQKIRDEQQQRYQNRIQNLENNLQIQVQLNQELNQRIGSLNKNLIDSVQQTANKNIQVVKLQSQLDEQTNKQTQENQQSYMLLLKENAILQNKIQQYQNEIMILKNLSHEKDEEQ